MSKLIGWPKFSEHLFGKKILKNLNIKKFIILLTLCFFLEPNIFSEPGYFYGNGFSTAEYKGTTATVRAYDLWLQQKQGAAGNLYRVNKLTKEDQKFLWGALDKYDYLPGEVYMILISYGDKHLTMTTIYVEVQKDKSVNWYGWTASLL